MLQYIMYIQNNFRFRPCSGAHQLTFKSCQDRGRVGGVGEEKKNSPPPSARKKGDLGGRLPPLPLSYPPPPGMCE